MSPPVACPVCGKPTDPKYRPFCSKRCADVDLGRWLRGDYRIPSASTDEDESPDREGEAKEG